MKSTTRHLASFPAAAVTPGAIASLVQTRPCIAVDSTTGDLLITEHGARGGDEINRIVPGTNYGWPVATGGIDCAGRLGDL